MAKKSNLTDAEKQKAKEQRLRGNRARFLKLAPKRVNNVLASLKRLSACGNRAGYVYSEEESKKILAAVDTGVAACKAAYIEQKAGVQAGFTL